MTMITIPARLPKRIVDMINMTARANNVTQSVALEDILYDGFKVYVAEITYYKEGSGLVNSNLSDRDKNRNLKASAMCYFLKASKMELYTQASGMFRIARVGEYRSTDEKTDHIKEQLRDIPENKILRRIYRLTDEMAEYLVVQADKEGVSLSFRVLDAIQIHFALRLYAEKAQQTPQDEHEIFTELKYGELKLDPLNSTAQYIRGARPEKITENNFGLDIQDAPYIQIPPNMELAMQPGPKRKPGNVSSIKRELGKQ